MLPMYLHRLNKQSKQTKFLPKQKKVQQLKYKRKAKQQSKQLKSMVRQLRHSLKSLNFCNCKLKLKLMILNHSLQYQKRQRRWRNQLKEKALKQVFRQLKLSKVAK